MNRVEQLIFPAVATAALSLVCFSAGATEVFTWTDADGVKHFSHTPPPENADAQAQEVGEIPSIGTVAAPPVEGLDNEQNPSYAEQTRQQLANDRDRREKIREVQSRLCEQAKTRIALIEPSRHVYFIDDSGETVRMDDEARAAEVEGLKNYIADNCQ